MYNEFTLSVIDIIKKIPRGKVLSYGLVALLAGNPRGARGVSWILHSMTGKHNLPWWRVVNSKGIISLKTPEGKDYQRFRLKQEGVAVSDDYRIDMNKYLWEIPHTID